ncbi:MAG TPA: beta-ketoacyl-ACP synthase III [Candidatus Omnitrophota bacterium]|nr:ketoacyl-ACP synthase III [Candidatus Omnitrophota bacterium]HPB68501.1 beta-ketoacyl-ACP synthase III [Candidatus Omnitrophota bacterium]HQO58951.1 beta-ketoacyl-ACP synthase III [Candidatus Omnitrophota bacterium]
MNNVGIVATGSFVPGKILTNAELERMVDTSDEWIVTRTGIKERRIAEKHERTSFLASQSAKDVLSRSPFKAEEIELIVVATTTPDSPFPSVACLVQKEIGAQKAAAFDVSAACSGFLFALTTAKQYIQTGLYKNALVIAADKFTSFLDWNDRNTCVLFGDGAGACLLAPVEEGKGILSDCLFSQGEQAELMSVIVQDREPLDQQNTMMRIPYVEMRGQELFKMAVTSMAEIGTRAIQKAGVAMEDIDCVVPHQANDRIISAVAKKLGIPKEKFYINIHRYGNMSAASLAVALHEAIEEKVIKEGSTVLFAAFGAGLVSAANVVQF